MSEGDSFPASGVAADPGRGGGTVNGEALNKALNKAADKFPQTMRPNMSGDPIAIPAVSGEARDRECKKIATCGLHHEYTATCRNCRDRFIAAQAAQDAAYERAAAVADHFCGPLTPEEYPPHGLAEGIARFDNGATLHCSMNIAKAIRALKTNSEEAER